MRLAFLLPLFALAATAADAASGADGDFKSLTSRIREKTLNLEAHLRKDDVDDGGGFFAPPTPFQHSAGYFKLNRTSAAEMFYFYFKSRGDPKDPVVLWMTGGPGCSSELAVFYENGPYAINPEDLSLSVNPFGWDTVSNLIYVDQPINTGFSYSTDPADDVHDEKRVAEDMLQFLGEFVDAHPELDGNEFYITGRDGTLHTPSRVFHLRSMICAFPAQVHLTRTRTYKKVSTQRMAKNTFLLFRKHSPHR